jgi:hypothetical protein
MGEMTLQGPHQGAQKSMMMGVGLLIYEVGRGVSFGTGGSGNRTRRTTFMNSSKLVMDVTGMMS